MVEQNIHLPGETTAIHPARQASTGCVMNTGQTTSEFLDIFGFDQVHSTIRSGFLSRNTLYVHIAVLRGLEISIQEHGEVYLTVRGAI
jgi:hypothetical protein